MKVTLELIDGEMHIVITATDGRTGDCKQWCIAPAKGRAIDYATGLFEVLNLAGIETRNDGMGAVDLVF